MAGDWIKMRTDLHSLPQFSRLRDELRVSSAELLMLLYRLAGWFEKHGDYGQTNKGRRFGSNRFLSREKMNYTIVESMTMDEFMAERQGS